MTALQIAVAVLAATFIFAFLGAVVGLFSADDLRITPDEEYRWLTRECGLTHDEALEYQRPIP